MKALITGGCGYIGSATALRLRELGHDILVIDDMRDSVASPGLFYGHICDGGHWMGSSIDDAEWIPSAILRFKPDVVLHFAGSTSVGGGELDPTGCAGNNIGAFARFLRLFPPDLELRVVNAGSAAVYAPMSATIPEVAPLEPGSFYGHTKLMAERLLEALSRHPKLKLTFVGLRYFNVVGQMYGIRERRQVEDHIVPGLVAALEAGKPFVVNGADFNQTADGSAIRDYVHIEDVVRANIEAAVRLAAGDKEIRNQYFNIASGVGTSVLDLSNLFNKLSGWLSAPVSGPRRLGDPAHLVADIDKARRILGWRAAHTLEEAIRSVLPV